VAQPVYAPCEKLHGDRHDEDPQSPYVLGYKAFCRNDQDWTRLVAFDADGARKDGALLSRLWVEKGELWGTLQGKTLRGADLAKVELQGILRNRGNPGLLRIATVERFAGGWKSDGALAFVYQLEHSADAGKSWTKSLCLDAKGRPDTLWAIPIPAWVDESGKVVSSPPDHHLTRFSLSCGLGAMAECLNWGYGPGQKREGTFQACLRAARADYCGVGEKANNTCPGTEVEHWSPDEATAPSKLPFEAAWGAEGVICRDHPRWADFPGSCEVPTCGKVEEAQKIAAQRGKTILFYTGSTRHHGQDGQCPASAPVGVVDK
jgi:hypothetical protein